MMVGLVIGIRQNGWDGAKKEYRPRLFPANKQKAHFCDHHHIVSATAELFRRNCKMSAKQNKVARLCASKLLLTPVRRM